MDIEQELRESEEVIYEITRRVLEERGDVSLEEMHPEDRDVNIEVTRDVVRIILQMSYEDASSD